MKPYIKNLALIIIVLAISFGSFFTIIKSVAANGEGGFWSGAAMSAQVSCANPSAPTVRLTWDSPTGDLYYIIGRDGAYYAGGQTFQTVMYTDTAVVRDHTYTYTVNGYTQQGTQATNASVTLTVTCASTPRTANFTVNGQTSIIATFDTYLDFEGTQQGNVGCDLNLNRQNNSYVGPYKRDGGAGVSFGGTNADGTTQLTFVGQDGTFNSSKYGIGGAEPQPYGGYNFELVCDDGSGTVLQRRTVYVDFSAPAAANLSVNSSNCSAAGLSWSISPGGISGSGTSGSYSVTPASGGTTYTISPSVSSSYTYFVSNSDGGGSSMLLYGSQNKSYSISCTANPCPPSQSQTLQCPSGYTGTYTQTTTYSPAPSCPATVTNNQSTSCVPNTGTLPACRIDSFPSQNESGGIVYPTWATSYSSNVVLSGGEFGSGVSVEPDGSRAINISSNTLLTITANAGATCSPSASASAWMYAETITPPPPPPPQSCSIDYFPPDGENGDGWVYPQWRTTNATQLLLSGGPFNNTSVAVDGSTAMQISQNTLLTLNGNGGQCTASAMFYAAAPPPPPPNFTATPGSCGTGQINLSWGISAGAGGYILYRDGTQIMNAGQNSFLDTGRTAGVTYSYTVIGTSPNGNTAPSSLTATAPSACAVVPTASLTASPTSVAYNSASTLTWSSANATSCTASGGWSGPKATAGTQSTGNLTANTTYTITCTGPGGSSVPASVTITVGIAPPTSPSGFTVAPTSCGNNWLNLSWYPPTGGGAPTNYKVYRDGGATPLYNGSGSDIQLGGGAMGFSDTGLVAGSSHNYTVTASNAGGTSVPASASGVVTANCTPTASIAANPTSVSYNSASTITWSSVNATSCTASGGWSGSKAVSGSQSTGNLTSNTTFTLTCTNAGINSAPVSANVTVGSAPPSFDYSLVQPQSVTVAKGGTNQFGQNIVQKNLSSGTSQAVDLSVSGLASGVSYSVANQGCLPTCSSTITYTVSPSATTGTQLVTITGSPLGKTTWFYMTVNPPTSMTINCSVSPSTAKVGQSVTWSATVSGGTPPYTTYNWTGSGVPSPAPTGANFTTSYSTTGIKSAQVSVTDTAGVVGTCAQVSTTINFDPTIIEF
jgi:hypothetical protein